MKRSLAFELETRRERNQRGASMGAIMAKAKREKTARRTTYAKLVEHFGRAPEPHRAVAKSNELAPGFVSNRIAVQLTRIAKGHLDSDGPDDALKNVRDGVADWLGVNDRDARIEWRRGAQEPGPEKLLGVRVEVFDDTPGPDRVIDLLDLPRRLAEEAATARRRVRGQVRKATRGRPTALDLRDAAERALAKTSKGGDAGVRRSGAPRTAVRDSTTGPGVRTVHPGAGPSLSDPGEERAACMLVPCEVCGAPSGKPCRFFGGEVGKYKAHPQRAKAAGHEIEIGAAIIRKHFGPRKLATVKPREAWLRTPWAKPCAACEGQGSDKSGPEEEWDICAVCAGYGAPPIRWAALDETAPPATWLTVPEKHSRCPFCGGDGHRMTLEGPGVCRPCKGTGRTGRIKMVRREWTRAGVACWLYEPA